MIVPISIGIFLLIIIISFIMLKLIKHYFNLSKKIEVDGGKMEIKMLAIFKNSLIFFTLLNFIFLALFLIL